MTSLSPTDRRFLTALSDLSFCNPFEPIRIELEQAALGSDFTAEDHATWSRTEATDRHERPNVVRITERANRLVEELRDKQLENGLLSDDEAALYDDLVTYVLYYRYLTDIPRQLLVGNKRGGGESRKIKTLWHHLSD